MIEEAPRALRLIRFLRCECNADRLAPGAEGAIAGGTVFVKSIQNRGGR